jgi:hydrogenase maturation protease
MRGAINWERSELYDPHTKKDADLMTDSQRDWQRKGRIVVLGLGNVLLKDEGIGVHVAQQLLQQNLGDNVEVIDGGTSSLDVLLLQEGRYKLVVVDAMKAGRKPGTIYKSRFRADQVDGLRQAFSKKEHSTLSLHQVGLVDALVVAQKTACAPDEVVIIGVEPNEIDGGLELTEPVSERMPEIINSVLEEIEDAVHER